MPGTPAQKGFAPLNPQKSALGGLKPGEMKGFPASVMALVLIVTGFQVCLNH